MEELPFSKNIRQFKKPTEIGDTNKIYFDPDHPGALIRVPTDYEAQFLVNDPKLIQVAEKYYKELAKLGKDLDIVVVPHQFILAQETSAGPVKPMLLAKRIEGRQLFPVDKKDEKILDALNRIALVALRYLDWIQVHRPKAVVTDIFRPEQYLRTPGKTRDVLTLVDIEPRLKEREFGIEFIRTQLFALGGGLYGSANKDTSLRIVQYFLRSLGQDRQNKQLASLINIMVNFPDFYQQFAEKFLAGGEPEISPEMGAQLISQPLVINRALLQRFGIEKL